MKVKIDTRLMPDWYQEALPTIGDELQRLAIYLGEQHVGEIVYVRSGNVTGWKPVSVGVGASLSSKDKAVRRLGCLKILGMQE